MNPYESPRTVSQPREVNWRWDKFLMAFTLTAILINLLVQIYGLL